MLSIDKILRDNGLLKQLTGLGLAGFAEILPKFEQELIARQTVRKPKRARAVGAGRKHHLESGAHKLFFILFYLRLYPTMRFGGVLFDAGYGRICEWVHEYQPVLEAVLGKSADLPKRRLDSMEAFIAAFPKVKRVIIDATERRRTRPKDGARQKSYYSGKKKAHTLKNTLLVDPKKRRILVVLPTVPGSMHDKKDIDQHQIVDKIPECIPIDVDLGYKGLENEFEGINIPHKKPRGAELSAKQRKANRKFSQKRIRVEHIIGSTKRYDAVSTTYRNRKEGFDDKVFITCAGLPNLYQRTKKAA